MKNYAWAAGRAIAMATTSRARGSRPCSCRERRPAPFLESRRLELRTGPAWGRKRGLAVDSNRRGQRADPLGPVTVVPSNHIGLALRRKLARQGCANVRFGVMGRVVEPFGAPALAVQGRTPMTAASEGAAMREAVRRAPRRSGGHHLRAASTGADQSIRWAKDTMIPSGPRTDAMRQMPSY